jgi:hypothetical protein
MSRTTTKAQRGMSRLQVVIGSICAALSLLLILPLARFGEQRVALKAEAHVCGAPVCAGDICSQTEWVGPNTLRVTAGIGVPLTRQVDPDTASVAIKGTSLRLTYITRARSFRKGEPVPACVIPVSLHFEVPGLVRQPYTVSARELPADIQYIFLGLGLALLLVPVLLGARVYVKARRLKVGARP